MGFSGWKTDTPVAKTTKVVARRLDWWGAHHFFELLTLARLSSEANSERIPCQCNARLHQNFMWAMLVTLKQRRHLVLRKMKAASHLGVPYERSLCWGQRKLQLYPRIMHRHHDKAVVNRNKPHPNMGHLH
jgi:hypothetical protein